MPGLDLLGFRKLARDLQMSSEIAITVKDVGKCYEIYEKPSDRLKQMFARGGHKFYREFWALKNVSIDIKRGETVGIIGRNGSGKSTLLQIICGTLNPSVGNVSTRGRIAALLELGSGFNPEFTGRENVYLNASILGLTKAEIDSRFDNIIDFADIGDFIDQPVKSYSSGMYLRLAFAVIAHVDADILIVDEALAVGDAVFTQKCMRFIRAFQKKGTLLFVSHDITSVINLCSRAIWLDGGHLAADGDAQQISEAYLQATLQNVYGASAALEAMDGKLVDKGISSENSLSQTATSNFSYESSYAFSDNVASSRGFTTNAAQITRVEVLNLTNPGTPIFKGGERVRVVIKAKTQAELRQPILGFVLNDRLGQAIFGENTLPFTDAHPLSASKDSQIQAEFQFVLPMLPNGDYALFASIADGDLHSNIQHHLLHDAVVVRVFSSKVRWGLVGVSFENVEMRICDENTA